MSMLEKKELKEKKEFLCIVPVAVVAVEDTIYNEKLADCIYNKVLPNTKDRERRYRTYRKGEYASYVDPVSRVNFKIIGAEAKRINDKEHAIILKRVNELKDDGVDIPQDIEIWELAASYEASLKSEKKALGKPKEIRRIPISSKKARANSPRSKTDHAPDAERAGVIKQLKALGESFHPNTSTENLKAKLAAKVGRTE